MTEKTGYPSIDKPWQKYYSNEAISSALPDMSMYSYIFERNKDSLDDIALTYCNRNITYRELFRNIDLVADALSSGGIRKGDRVGVCVLTSPEAIYLLYAINKIGAINVLLGFTSLVADLREQIISTNCKEVFCVEMAYSKIVEATNGTNVKRIVSIPLEYSMPYIYRTVIGMKLKHPKLMGMSVRWKDYIRQSGKMPYEVISGTETAVIEFTGGSTGTPKGVMISNNAANAFHEQYRYSLDMFNCHRQDSFLANLPPYIAFCTFPCFHNPLCFGARLILAPNPKPEAFPSQIIKYRPNHFCTTPYHIEELMKNKKARKMNYSFICEAIYGGTKRSSEWEEEVSKFLMSKGCKFPLINGYGMTETAGAFAVANIQNGKMMPYAKNNVMILDQETGEELKYELEGEVCVSSPTLMTGYYGDCSENNILFEKDGCIWMHTGDMGKVMPDGELIITGRIKRIYGKISKEGAMVRVYPMRIEEEISKIPEVASVAVVGKKNSSVAFLSYAFIIPKNDNFDREKLKTIISDYCFKNLPESHIPDEYVFLDDFPLTRAGKVDYMELEKMIE